MNDPYLCRDLIWVFWATMSVQYQCQGCKRMCSIQDLFYCSGCNRLLCTSISCIIREIDYYYCPICLDTMTSSELWKNYYQCILVFFYYLVAIVATYVLAAALSWLQCERKKMRRFLGTAFIAPGTLPPLICTQILSTNSKVR